MKRTILLILAGFALYSCQSNKSILSTNYVAGSTYSGTVACVDCDGVKQVVVLDSNNRFKLSETYIGKNAKCTEKCGNWSLQDGKVMLYSDNSTVAQYAVSGANLVYLAENNLTKGTAGQGMLSKKKMIHSKKINEKFLEGLDIVAFAPDASWSLDITHDKAIQFSVSGLEAPITFSPVTPNFSGDSLLYNINTPEEKMSILFTPGICDEGESVYDYKVTIHFRGKNYNGCGAVLNANGSLDGAWILESFADHQKNWSEQPYVVIDINNKKFFGFTGCNDFAGTIRLKEDAICFSDINAASKECKMYNETAFIETLIKCNGYRILDTTLELTQNGKSIMIFQRKLNRDNQL